MTTKGTRWHKGFEAAWQSLTTGEETPNSLLAKTLNSTDDFDLGVMKAVETLVESGTVKDDRPEFY